MVIKVYWREHCLVCKEVFRYLDERNLSYEKIDVTYNQTGFDEMIRLGGFATPLIVVEGRVISYFESEKMDQILEVI